MKSLATGKPRFAFTRHATDNVGAVDKALASGRIKLRVDGAEVAHQRHVLAIVQIETHADRANTLGQADAIDVDVIGVGTKVLGAHQASQTCLVQVGRIDQHRGQGVRGIAVVEAQGAIQPLRAPPSHQAEVPGIVWFDIMPARRPIESAGPAQ
ncbi:hypothetical protein D3C78_966040 [compost metagenome]